MHDHEFLDVDRGIGVRATVHDVHHGHRQGLGIDAAQVAEQGLADAFRGRLGAGQRNGEDGVGAQLLLGRGAVQLDHDAVHAGLVKHLHADQLRGDQLIGIFDGLAHALAQVAFLVAIAQLDRLVLAGRCAGGDRRTAHHAAIQHHIRLDSRVAPRIQNFTRLDPDNFRHMTPFVSF